MAQTGALREAPRHPRACALVPTPGPGASEHWVHFPFPVPLALLRDE